MIFFILFNVIFTNNTYANKTKDKCSDFDISDGKIHEFIIEVTDIETGEHIPFLCDDKDKKPKKIEKKDKTPKAKVPRGRSAYTLGLSALATTVALTPYANNEFLQPVTDIDNFIRDAEDDFIEAVTNSVKSASLGNGFYKNFLSHYFTQPEVLGHTNLIKNLYPEYYALIRHSIDTRYLEFEFDILKETELVMYQYSNWHPMIIGYIISKRFDFKGNYELNVVSPGPIDSITDEYGYTKKYVITGTRPPYPSATSTDFNLLVNKANTYLKDYAKEKTPNLYEFEERYKITSKPEINSSLYYDNENVYLPDVNPENFPDFGQSKEYEPKTTGIVEIDSKDFLEVEYETINPDTKNPEKIKTVTPARPKKNANPKQIPVFNKNDLPNTQTNIDNSTGTGTGSTNVPKAPNQTDFDGKTCGDYKLDLKSIDLFTTKFPFSLPWDIFNAINALFGGMGNDEPNFKMKVFNTEIDIVIPDFIKEARPFMSSIILFIFDVSLIYALYRLFGGAS